MGLQDMLEKGVKNLKEQVQNAAMESLAQVGDVEAEKEKVGGTPKPVQRKVMVVIYNPKVPSQKNRKLSEVMGWNDPDKLTPEHIKDWKECSYGYANFQVVERIEVDRFPVKADGFAYEADSFVNSLKSNSGFHKPDEVDYQAILKDFDIIDKVNAGKVDEVWLYAFPYAGFYESIMAGPGAFWCNAPALKGTESAKRLFVIMGYNYQRGAGEMLENVGHRAESILDRVFRGKKGDENLWARFSRHEKTHPGQSEVGIVHFAPNSVKDYDWGNKTKVKSRAHTWANFPNLDGEPREVDCSTWGNGDTRAHHQWWFKYFPHITGGANGVAYNWWKYVVDPNTVK